jgi:hypothetical protein
VRPRPRTVLSLVACAAALTAAGCGSKDDDGDPIPRGVTSAISEELGSVQKRLDYATSHPTPGGEGACNDIEDDSFPRIESELGRVPDGVKQDVRDALTQSVDRLQELTRAECDKVSEKVDNADTTPTDPTPTVPQPETPTVPEETTTTTPTTPEKPKKQPKQPKQSLPGQGDQQPGTGGGGAGAPGTP